MFNIKYDKLNKGVLHMEELEKRVREKFFEEKEYSKEHILKFIERIADFVTVNPKTQEVNIIKSKLTNKEKVGLVVIARFLANQLEKTISSEVTIEEVVKYTRIDEPQVRARLSELVDENVLHRVAKGVYSVRSFPAIEKWVNNIIEKYSGEKG